MPVRLTLAAPALILSVLAAVGLTGCGQSGGPAAYLWRHGTRVVFVAWQRSPSGDLTGIITTDFANGAAPGEKVTSESAAFSGTVRGTSVSLITDASRGKPSEFIVGTLRARILALQFPSTGGAIAFAPVTPSSRVAFNRAARAIRAAVGHANAAAGARSQAAADTAANRRARAACARFGGAWTAPAALFDDIGGYTFQIPGPPSLASCRNVAYVSAGGVVRHRTVTFSANGRPAPGRH